MMHSPPKRPSSLLQKSSMIRVTAIQSRPGSARSTLSPSSLPDGCTSRQKQLRGEPARVSASDSKAAHKNTKITPDIKKAASSGDVATVGLNSKSVPMKTLPTSKSKGTAALARPVSRLTRRPLTPDGTSGYIASNGTTSRKGGPSGQKLGPENWTPITAGKITICTPPRLKFNRQKRASVLPREDGLSIFGPVQTPQNETDESVFYKLKCDSPLSISNRHSRLVSPSIRPVKTSTRSESPEPVQELRRARAAASLPSRHLRLRAGAANKSVSWDPSVTVIEPKMVSDSETSLEKRLAETEADMADEQTATNEPDVNDCVKTIRQWGNADKSKLASLIEVLKEMELTSKDITEEVMDKKAVDRHDEEVVITTLQSLNPRVPDFQFPQIAKTKEEPGKVDESKRCSSAKLNPDHFVESDSNKENIPELPFESQVKLQVTGNYRTKKRAIAILDDHDLPGREVNSFDRWYGEMQLREFVKKYPLTGSKAPAVRSSAKNSAKTLRSLGNTRRISSGSGPSSMKEFKLDTGGKKGVCGTQEAEIQAQEGKRKIATDSCRGECNSRPIHPRSKRRAKPFMTDPSARINAAIIQQRLEMLLLKEKERKVFGDVPEQLAVLPYANPGLATLGHWGWSENLFAEGLEYEGGAFGPVWVPSERLRL